MHVIVAAGFWDGVFSFWGLMIIAVLAWAAVGVAHAWAEAKRKG